MTDTHSPITGPHPAPMFDTGPLPILPPTTEPHPAPIFDTGPHPEPLEPLPSADAPEAFSQIDGPDTDAFPPPTLVPPRPVIVPGSYQFVKRWRFALIVAGVWAVAAIVGLGFYFWWYTSLDKTLPVFAIFVYLMACMTAAILVSLIPDRPQVTSLALALMAAPLASMGAAALLHGAYFFEWITRPTIG